MRLSPSPALLLPESTAGVFEVSPPSNGFANAPNGLQVDGSRSEIYAASQCSYTTYTYNSSGLTQLATNGSGNYASFQNDEIQVTGGRLYTDFDTVDDAESGALLGTFYTSATNPAQGSTIADTTLGKAFILDDSLQYSGTVNQIQVFNTADFTPASSSVIPVNLPANLTFNSQVNRLTRWRTNGLAFRANFGVVSLRSNLVKDLSSVSSDLSVTLASSGSNATGANTTYTATVTNNGPSAATSIGLAAFAPSTGVLVSAMPSAGTCTSGSTVSCDLQGLPNGGTATVSFVVQQLTAGSASFAVQVSGSETDPNLANNQATATPTITGAAYSPAPTLTALNPSTVEAGATDTIVTVSGSGFTSASSVLLNGAALPTTVASSTQLSATIPSADLANLGWSSIAVSSAAPGGGVSAPLPFSVYSVITLGLNHIVYDPYTRNIMASVGSGS